MDPNIKYRDRVFIVDSKDINYGRIVSVGEVLNIKLKSGYIFTTVSYGKGKFGSYVEENNYIKIPKDISLLKLEFLKLLYGK